MVKFKRRTVYGPLAPTKYLTVQQITQLRNHLDQLWRKRSTKYGNRRLATTIMIIDVLLNTGLRASEACQLQLQDLPTYHGKPSIHVRNSKGRKCRVIGRLSKNSCVIEFLDNGQKEIISRNALRRVNSAKDRVKVKVSGRFARRSQGQDNITTVTRPPRNVRRFAAKLGVALFGRGKTKQRSKRKRQADG